ncbi:MAG: tandem-95 repeat protein, partial [Alphaproteobacteria bacterium]
TGQTISFRYEVRDADGDTDIATVTFKVEGPVNSVIANDDTVTMARNLDSILINAKANDTDPQGDAFSITRIVSTSAGTATIENGQVRFSYDADTAPRNGGSYTIVYEVTDSKGAKDTATITVTVPALANNVIANDDVVTMAKDVNSILINAKANDTDPQGDAFSITRIVSVTGGGTATIENGQVRYVNGTRDAGTAYITYEVTDALGAKDTAVIKVNIVADTNSVIANDDTVTMARDVNSILINAKANDVDPQGDAFSITRIVSVSGGGSATIENGQVRYTNSTRDAGTAYITYEITDAKGAKDTAVIKVNITADTNSVIANDDVVTMAKDVNSILINAKANDVDPQGDAFSITRIVSVSGGGTATIENGQVRYVNSTRDAGTAYITYEITDAKGAKDTAVIKVNITADTNSVIANDDNVTMARDVNSILINAKANDTDPQGDAFSITRIVSVSGGGSATIENGQVRYTNSTRDAGTAYITYEITDSKGAKDTAVIKVNIVADTNSVIANDDNVTMARDVNSILINAKANDTDPQGDAFSITRIVSVSGGGSATIENGQVRYTNGTRDAGTAYITYEITDAKGAKDTAVIKVDIVADTNNVVAVDDNVTMARDDNSILINARANDFDPQGDAFSITRIVSVSGGGSASIENGQVRYVNDTRDAGTAYITYEITDAKGAKDTAVIKVDIVADTNNVVAVDDNVTMGRDDNSILINARANDFDPQGDAFSITRIVSVSGGGSASIENGQVRYVNDTRDAGTAYITYEITDAKGAKDTAVIKVDIVADTNSVVAVNDTATMGKDVNKITINAKANDFDPQGDAFNITRIVSVSSGKATIVDGKVVYENDTRDAGKATIVYEITDSKGAKDTATITVDIAADSNSVVARNDSASTTAGSSTNIRVLANDYDPQGDSFRITRIVNDPSQGSARVNSNGTITYTATRAGTYTFTYEIVDSKGAKDTATV